MKYAPLLLIPIALLWMYQPEETELAGIQESLFAEIDDSNIVIRVIVAEQSFIDSGAVGNPSNWIQTYKDGSVRGYAGSGDSYDPVLDRFIPAPVREDSTFDEESNSWVTVSATSSEI